MLFAVNRRRAVRNIRGGMPRAGAVSNVYGDGRLPRRPQHAVCNTLVFCCPLHSGSQIVDPIVGRNVSFPSTGWDDETPQAVKEGRRAQPIITAPAVIRPESVLVMCSKLLQIYLA